jgi:hypothetical protein
MSGWDLGYKADIALDNRHVAGWRDQPNAQSNATLGTTNFRMLLPFYNTSYNTSLG